MAQSRQLLKILKGKVWKFFGGIKPQELKHTTAIPIRTLPIPAYVTLPVNRHLGSGGSILVQVGDKVKVGQKLTQAGGSRNVPLHASISGKVVAIGQSLIPHASGISELCITIKSDGKDESVPNDPIENWQDAPIQTLLDRIRDYGVEGLGGAQFQTAAKLSSSIKDNRNCNIFIVNGCECEPVATCDDRLMQERAKDIALGIAVIKKILNPQAVIVAIEDNKPNAIKAMQEAIGDLAIVRVLPTLYPSGAARNLIKIITGIEIPYNAHTSDCGIVVDNVETVFAVKQAIVDGIPLTQRTVTVDGAKLSDKGNAWIRLGTSVSFVLENYKLKTDDTLRVIIGGPFMGFTAPSLQIPVTKSCTCIFVPDEKELPYAGTTRNCIRCGRCARVCPSRLVPYRMYALSKANDHKKTLSCGIKDCTECGCCAFVCPSKIALTTQFKKEKTIIRLIEDKQRRTDRAKERMKLRDERLQEEAKIREAKRQAALARIAKQKEASANATSDINKDSKADSDDFAKRRQQALLLAKQRAMQKKLEAKESQASTAAPDIKIIKPIDNNVTKTQDLSPDELKKKRQAAIAAALARKQAQANSTTQDIKIVKPLTNDEAKPQLSTPDLTPDELKKRRQAAIAAALAKKRAQANSTAQDIKIVKPISNNETQNQALTQNLSPEELKKRRQAAIAAALAKKRAQANSTAQDIKIVKPLTNDEAKPQLSTPDLTPDELKKRRQAAIAAALAKKRSQQQNNTADNNEKRD